MYTRDQQFMKVLPRNDTIALQQEGEKIKIRLEIMQLKIDEN